MTPQTAPLRVRPFRLDDAGAVEPWLTGPGLSLPGGTARTTWPQRLLADARIVAQVAEAGGSRVGFVRLDCGPDRVAELTLVVAPEVRRRGLGKAMFAAALERARRLGLRRLVAIVDLGNQPALAFFAELGFVHDGLLADRLRLVRLVHAGDHQRPLDIEL
jgi:RimJ/RimL family protein N-acetyltransferase